MTTANPELHAELAKWHTRLAQNDPFRKERLSAVHAASQRFTAARAKTKLAHPSTSRNRAMHAALGYVGTKEHPADSNTGPHIDAWERNFGIHAQPWCGAFAGSMVELGGAKPTARIVFCPYIYDDARTGKNGLSHVVWARGGGFTQQRVAHTCDLVLYDFGGPVIEHVELLHLPWHGSGLLNTVGGNTSFTGAGSQSNGGCVAMKQRDPSQVRAIVTMAW